MFRDCKVRALRMFDALGTVAGKEESETAVIRQWLSKFNHDRLLTVQITNSAENWMERWVFEF